MIKALAQALFLLSIASSAFAFGGGEDFPFRCEAINDFEIKSFAIRPDLETDTGYVVTYRTRLGLRGQIAVSIHPTDDGRHYEVRGAAPAPTMIFTRHMKALIARYPGETSSVSFQLTFPGFKPIFSARLDTAECYVP